MNRIIIIICIIFTTLSVFAQKGTIRGKVIDKNTAEELTGATIIIKGTYTGTITDFDGNYSLLDLDTGLYDLRCSFISYEPVLISNIKVNNNDIVSINFNLNTASVDIKEIKIEAKAIKRTEAALLLMQKKSATLMDGISAQQISKMGDSDAAGALKRSVGISVEGGKYVYVRGLGDRYSKTTLNGAEIPGLDPNRNTVQMDIFPANLIENIIIYKTFSPDLPGSFTGGYINIVTKDFPEKFIFEFSTSLGFNPQSNLNPKFLSYKGGKYDWLGIDDASRELPVKIEDIPNFSLLNKDEYHLLDNLTKSFNKNMEPVEQTSFINHNSSFSIGNQVDFFGKPLGFIAGFTYSRDYNYYDNGSTGFYKLTGSNANKLNKEYFYQDRKGKMEVLTGGMLNLNYKLSNNHKLSFNLLKNQSGEKSARYLYGQKPSDDIGMYIETRAINFIERSFISQQLRGKHCFINLFNLKINWLSSYTVSKQDEPDLRFFTNSHYPEYAGTQAEYALTPSLYKVPVRYFRNMKELNFDNKIDAILSFNLFSKKSKFKFGGAYVYKKRDFEENRVDYFSQIQYYNGDVSEYLSDNNIGTNHPRFNGIDYYGLYVQEATDIKNSYFADQTIISGYLLTDMLVTQKLRVVTGARVEKTDILSESKDPTKDKGKLNDFDFLPALNITYFYKKNTNLRFAYSKTLARPTFRELAPFASEDFQGGATYIGNPDLKRTLINNVDLRFEIFMNPGEIFSFSLFYKNFTNPIELVDNPIAVNPEITWHNVNKAKVTGTEIELRKNLDFISLLKNFSFGTNIAFIKSTVSIDSIEYKSMLDYNPNAKDTRVMFGQAPYILNAFLGYLNNSLGINANLAYNITGKKLVVVMKKGNPNVFEQPKGQLDFNISKNLGKYTSIKFSVKNILNAENKLTYDWAHKEYIYSNYSLGRTFSLGFSYSIK
ncbi:MAG: TonB-dependent receptor [Bacteroidales bacterium]|nr:TonB-dependent receptor [Bacteroidales bacterium]